MNFLNSDKIKVLESHGYQVKMEQKKIYDPEYRAYFEITVYKVYDSEGKTIDFDFDTDGWAQVNAIFNRILEKTLINILTKNKTPWKTKITY